MFDIQNRRYTGNKYKLMSWISELIFDNCKDCHSFFDVFAGTGSVTNYLFEKYDRFILNDFLFSNEIIYKGFFSNEKYDISKLNIIINHKVKIIICVPNVILLMNNMLKQLKIIIINT